MDGVSPAGFPDRPERRTTAREGLQKPGARPADTGRTETMMRMGIVEAGLSAWIALAVLVAAPTSGWALSFDDVVIEGEVGAGSQEAMIVADWKSGATPSHAWLFRFDGFANLASAFDAIELATGGSFDWDLDPSGFVVSMDYDDGAEQHVTTHPGWLSFWSSADGETWIDSQVGVLDQLLVDGGWAGANPNLSDDFTLYPGPAPQVPIPEPATGLLAGLGLALLGMQRRRRP